MARLKVSKKVSSFPSSNGLPILYRSRQYASRTLCTSPNVSHGNTKSLTLQLSDACKRLKKRSLKMRLKIWLQSRLKKQTQKLLSYNEVHIMHCILCKMQSKCSHFVDLQVMVQTLKFKVYIKSVRASSKHLPIRSSIT